MLLGEPLLSLDYLLNAIEGRSQLITKQGEDA